MTWRNALLHRVAPVEGPRVKILPFENLTAPRWEYHNKMVSRKPGVWTSDCTHFCYSPRWWDLTFNDLHGLL